MLPPRQREGLRDLEAALGRWDDAASSCVSWLGKEVAQLFDSDRGAVLGYVAGEDRPVFDFLEIWGASAQRYRSLFDAMIARQSTPARWAPYDYARPEPEQRNRAVGVRRMLGPGRLEQVPIYQQAILPAGLGQRDQLRVLVCERGSLLAWLGVFRPDDYTPGEVALMQRLVPSVRRRLLLERRVAEAGINQLAVSAALEAIPRAAFIVKATGAIVHLNAAGRGWLASQRPRRRLLPLSDPLQFELTPLMVKGAAQHYLALQRDGIPDLQVRLGRAQRQWGLTGRQAEVLARVVDGCTNREIAAELRCAVHTVELHVSAVLAAAGVANRAELATHFWTC